MKAYLGALPGSILRSGDRGLDAASPWTRLVYIFFILILLFSTGAPAFAGGGGCTGNGCITSTFCSLALRGASPLPGASTKVSVQVPTFLDSYSDMGDVVVVSPTVRESTWLSVTAEGTMGDFGDAHVTIDETQGPSVYRMISQSATGDPFFPVDVECDFFWLFQITHPLTGEPVVLRSNPVTYTATDIPTFPPPPGTTFSLDSSMTLTSENDTITCTAGPGDGSVVYSGVGIEPPILINELNSDAGGNDLEFIELYDGGQGETPLDDVLVVLFDGTEDRSYGEVLDLTGHSTDKSGFFVIGDAGVDNVDLVKTAQWLDGPAAVALYVIEGGSFPLGSPVTTNNLMEAIVYGPAADRDAGLLELIRPEMPQVDEAQIGNGTAHSLQRIPDGGWRRATRAFRPRLPTPGRLNQQTVLEIPTLSHQSQALLSLLLIGVATWFLLFHRKKNRGA